MNDRYEILQLLTKDQVGGVYLAEDLMLGRKVAFRNFERVVGEEMLTGPDGEFARFSGKLTALQHPNLITIFDIAFDDGEVYMVTQYVEDESLAERLEMGPMPQDRVYRMAGDVLEALHAAHESGIFHGALNTQSVRRMPKASGGHRYMVVDMGLNRLATIIRGASGGIVDPILIAPELHDGGEADARADLFMLGQLCYTALAGGHPFAGKTGDECSGLYLSEGLPPLADYVSGVQDDFVQWVRHLAEGDPGKRPAGAQEAMQLLNGITLPDPEPPAPVATPPSPAAQGQPATQPEGEAVPGGGGVTAVKPGKKPLAVIAALVVVIAAMAAFLMLRKPGGAEVPAVGSGIPAVPDGVLVHMHSAAALDSGPVDLEKGTVLDWSVTTGEPVSSTRQRMEGGKYISGVFPTGNFKEVADKDATATFRAGGRELVSKGVINAATKAEAGQGWEVSLRVPKSHEGPLLIRFYVLHMGCGFTVSANAGPGIDNPVAFDIDASDAGKSMVLLEIPEPAQGGFYTFRVVAGTPVDKAFSFGLGAIQVGGK